MVSDFIVQHPCGPFFSLSDAEFAFTAKKFPSLSNPDGIYYLKNSASAGINVGEEGYFNNEIILAQSEHLFMLLPFKKAFDDHVLEIEVDNARTHAAKAYSINDFSKSIRTQRPVNFIHYFNDDGQLVSISCYFLKVEHKRKSRGLVELSKDLNMPISSSMKLAEIRNILSSHPAFQNVSKLEMLARKYQVKVIFCPKFHCELNAIEGLWCDMKRYIRVKTDQTFPTMLRLIPQSRQNFEQRYIQMKLFRRFWRCIEAYSQGKPYGEILTFFCSQLCQVVGVSHRNVTNSKLS